MQSCLKIVLSSYLLTKTSADSAQLQQLAEDTEFVLGQFEANNGNADDIVQGYETSSSSMGDTDSDTAMPTLRSLLEPGRETGTSLNYLNGYGCWCNFDNYKAGRGQPKDALDSSCKRLHDNYLCISEQFKLAGEVCEPHQVDYVSSMIYVYIADAIFQKIVGRMEEAETKKARFEQYCRDKNPGETCATEACLAEAHFLYDVSPLYGYPADSEPGAPMSAFSHSESNPQFDFASECNTGNMGNIDIQCCGVTPDRHRYDSNKNSKACCDVNGAVYNPLMYCCNSGGVFRVGSGNC